jgi:hypothetical protein
MRRKPIDEKHILLSDKYTPIANDMWLRGNFQPDLGTLTGFDGDYEVIPKRNSTYKSRTSSINRNYMHLKEKAKEHWSTEAPLVYTTTPTAVCVKREWMITEVRG